MVENIFFNSEGSREALLDHISTESKAFFRHQQIDEPELNVKEKRQIAAEILDNSHYKFLQRFGMHLKEDHLKYLESQEHRNNERQEIEDHIKHLRWILGHQSTIIRNRRYCALVSLIKGKKYFSENEMQSRDPLLFEQLIGQYQSREEKVARRRPNPETSTLVDVLLEGIDNEQNCEVVKKQREEENRLNENHDDDADSRDSMASKTSDDEAKDCKQWGEFDEPASSKSEPSSAPRARKRAANLITATERDLLREEFFGIMYSNFLSGRDSEFHYSTVDDNDEYDDVKEADQDFEDR